MGCVKLEIGFSCFFCQKEWKFEAEIGEIVLLCLLLDLAAV